MNALDEHCKVVIGINVCEVEDSWAGTCGYHGRCALPSEVSPSFDRLLEDITSFCTTHNVPCARRDVFYSPESDVEKLLTDTITVVEVKDAAAYTSLLRLMTLPKAESPHYVLVCSIDLSRSHPLSEPPLQGSLVPTQSYVDELGNEKGPYYSIPYHLYSPAPIVRDVGTPTTQGSFNYCTLSAILKELSFKAGKFPKYGN
ncbi:hypothetical protein AGDE_08541 [Angomonas deanei]|uniref:Uncharacterized protein n=1 Tax=Angomonas deanei TaxID=59799 RepID=A0A7G2C142_9TRYP|nr:hypothetical protein AGDE_08541 [Angomonas deanei]CAD2213488.1 hypothetical protein, conserved [Angomonas deanei]|eukprot:EPY32592.1 hypothetical protein AGDE_08541 [Angomonas deanei]